MLSILEQEEDPDAFDDLQTLFPVTWSQREPEFATYFATYYANRPGMIFRLTLSMQLHGSKVPSNRCCREMGKMPQEIPSC